MCNPSKSGSFVCGDAARKHLFPLPFGVTPDGRTTLVFEETIRSMVALRLHQLASLGLCAAKIENLMLREDAPKGGLQN